MRKEQAALPLAFALAMAVDAGAPLPSNLITRPSPMRAGLLSELNRAQIGHDLSSDSKQYQQIHTRDRVVQFFPNFKNCITGTWRNC